MLEQNRLTLTSLYKLNPTIAKKNKNKQHEKQRIKHGVNV